MCQLFGTIIENIPIKQKYYWQKHNKLYQIKKHKYTQQGAIVLTTN